MLKISKLTDYALVILGVMASHPEKIFNVLSLAGDTRLPQPTIAKILKLLAGADILLSKRGAKGGYQLAVQPEKLSVAQIIAAMEGNIALTACVEGASGCELTCQMRGRWNKINQVINQALSAMSLADMLENEPKLGRISQPKQIIQASA
ncbi:MAG: SUF system Fe-S cluster assembly regulator [Alphaproteobacteria bacterium]